MTKPKTKTNEIASNNCADNGETVVGGVGATDANKKRGRKPKGGKIKTKEPEITTEVKPITNIILHLKCSMNDLNEFNNKISKLVTDPLEYKPEIPPVIMSSISRSEIGNTFYDGMTYNNDNLYPTFGGGATAGGVSLLNSFSSFTDEFSSSMSIGGVGGSHLDEETQKYKTNETLCKNIAYPIEEITHSGNKNGTNPHFFNPEMAGKPDENCSNFRSGWCNSYVYPNNSPNPIGGGNGGDIDTQIPPTISGSSDENRQQHGHHYTMDDVTDKNEISNKEINAKLKKLKIQLYKNTNTDKKSACFWCSFDYDNPPCYIPKNEQDQTVVGYGSFCRPECAVAFLMKENIDDTTKFERYHLINKIYGKIYNYTKNIKPAPNPFYTLDKYYGNMTIQEYRKLLKTEHTLLVLEKPLTRILPEIHEDNEELVLNSAFSSKNYFGSSISLGNAITNNIAGNIVGGNDLSAKHNPFKKQGPSVATSNGYKVKKQNDANVGPSKTAILKNTFGIS